MKKLKISISTVSILSLSALTSIIFCLLGYLYYNHQKKVDLAELYSGLITTTNQLSKGLSIAVWNFDEDQVEGILKSGLEDGNIDAIIIEYNDVGKTNLSVSMDSLSHFHISKGRIKPAPDDILIDKNIYYSDDLVGKITVCGTPVHIYKKIKSELILIAFFTFLLIVIMIIGVYYIFYFIVIRPLQLLESFALSINLESLNLKGIEGNNFFREFDNLRVSLKKMIHSLGLSYKKLEESERQYKEMANLLPISVFELGLDGNITFINEMGIKVFDFKRTEIEEGASFSSRVNLEGLLPMLKSKLLLGNENNTESVNEYKILKNDGTSLPMMFYSSVMYREGIPVGVRGVGIDLTKQRESEKAINELLRLDFIKEKQSEKLRALSLIEGQEMERLRISREIHDGIGQMITAIKLSSESIDTASITSERDLERFIHTKSMIHDVIIELRQVSNDLAPTFLYDYGIFSATSQLVNNVSRISDMNIQLNSNVQKVRFSSLVEITLYRIIQEGINNILKYSQAKNCKINLIQDAEFLELLIEDDGVGVDLSLKGEEYPEAGNGLQNIAFRANLLDSYLSILSAPGEGFQINVQVPLENPAAGPAKW